MPVVVDKDGSSPKDVLVDSEVMSDFFGDATEYAGQREPGIDVLEKHKGVERPEGDGVDEVPLQRRDFLFARQGHRKRGEFDGKDAHERKRRVGNGEQRGVELALHVERLYDAQRAFSCRSRVRHASRCRLAL